MTVADAECAVKRKQTRKELFMIELDQVVPWDLIDFNRSPAFKIGDG
ncbi:hypothetical protein SAMN05878282_102377 [Aquipseudomonas alcaligenes]|uniref:IS5/IS1182 family transposase n=1 Tax=Aquipseudomonas alcaligenes TaxID=43263 RepID=A0A1N6QCN1_AQUAC|nr:hypothetical protein SAMN05878282_102377 [Pseudomonas alcaligenes]